MSEIPTCVHKRPDGRLCDKVGRGFEGYCIKHQNFRRIDDSAFGMQYVMETNYAERIRTKRWTTMKRHNAARKRSDETAYYLEALESQAENFGYLLRGLAMMADPFNNGALPEEIRRVTNNLESVAFHIGSYAEHADIPEDPRSIGEILWNMGLYPDGRLNKNYVRRFVKKTLNCIRYALKTKVPQRAWWLRLLTLTRHLRDMEKMWDEDLIFEHDDAPGDTETEETAPVHPPGSIDLVAFFGDSQNVHTQPARESTEKALSILMKRSGFKGSVGDSVETHLTNTTKDIGFTLDQRTAIVGELASDGLRVSAFGQAYSDVFLRVWDKVLTVDTVDILRRLTEELYDGMGMCNQGKMTRLVNVLRGFDEELDECSSLTQGELLQMVMAAISKMPVEEREAAATKAFTDIGIEKAAQEGWLSAVMDA